MMPAWVRIRHNVHGGETVIVENALPGHQRRGWELVTEEPERDLLPADPVKEPDESNDTEEN